MSLTPIAAVLMDAAQAEQAKPQPADAAPPKQRGRAKSGAAANDGAAAGGTDGGRQRGSGIGPGFIARQLDWPDEMPVEPLGHQGLTYFYMDEARQLQAVPADKHGRAIIFALFGKRADVLLRHWHKTNKDGDPTYGFHADQVANALMVACARKGLIDPHKQLRAQGAWADETGGLVLHCGDQILIGGEWHPPGQFGRHIYPAAAPTRRPATERQGTDPGAELLNMLDSWHWRLPVQAVLTAGWIVQGFVTGALKWRVHLQVDGERGAGKSSLMDLAKGLLGEWILATSNATPASIYQLMGGRAHAVLLDEFEAGRNAKRKADVVALLTEASSGGKVTRGGDDHQAREFSLQFGAMLTSIVPVQLQAQDESRVVRANLLPLKDHPRPMPLPDLSDKRLERLGRQLMRRVIDQWHRWLATLAAYRQGLEQLAGFDSRLQDTYGTLLALHDLLAHSTAPSQHMAEIDNLVMACAAIVQPQLAEADRDQDRCLAHLLQSTVERGMGERRTVGSWLRQACAFDSDGQIDVARRKTAIDALGAIGLKPVVVHGRHDPALLPKERRALFVVNEHPGLSRVFQDTQWPGEAGAHGAWVTVLRRCEGASVPNTPMNVGGISRRGTLVPVGRMVEWDDAE